MTPVPSMAIGIVMATIAEFVLRVGFAVALIFASPFLLLFILSYQEHPDLAFIAGAIAF